MRMDHQAELFGGIWHGVPKLQYAPHLKISAQYALLSFGHQFLMPPFPTGKINVIKKDHAL